MFHFLQFFFFQSGRSLSVFLVFVFFPQHNSILKPCHPFALPLPFSLTTYPLNTKMPTDSLQCQLILLRQPQQQQQHILHPLELPEILHLLAATLQNDTRTLSKCSRVNNTWHEAFNPQLWRTLCCSRLLPLGQLSRKAIDRNIHLVHQIRVGKLDQTRYGTLKTCRNLRRLHLEDERVSEWDLLGLGGSSNLTGSTGAAGTAVGAGKAFPETSIAISSGSLSSSIVVDAADTAAGTSSSSTSGADISTEDDVTTQLDYDGDDEDEHYYSGDRWIKLLITLINQNPFLHKICIMMERFEPTAAFWESIEQATTLSRDERTIGRGRGGGGALKSLECVFTRFPNPQLATSFLKSLTGLESLVLQHCTFDGPFFPPNILHGRQYPSLQSLTLATNTGIDLQTQLEFIQCFPNVQSLSWSTMGSHDLPLPEFCTLLRSHCPQISSLVLSDRNLEAPDLTQILLAIPRLVRFFLRFDILQSMFNDKGVMDAMRRHFGTLKDLEFGQVRSTIRCGTVLELLRGCPELERLVAYGRLDCSREEMLHYFPEGPSSSSLSSNAITVSATEEAVQDSNASAATAGGEGAGVGMLSESNASGGEHQHDGHQGQQGDEDMAKDVPWACLGLKTLRVIMTGDPQNVWSNRSLQHRFFHQLGRLSKLQHLSLGHCILWMYEYGYSHHGLDFTLQAGLAKLSGLHKLEELNLEGICQMMGERDVEWMLEHWPRLRVVEGELHHKREERLKLDGLMERKGFKILNHSYRR